MSKFHEISLDSITLSEYHNKKIVISDENKKLIKFQIPRMYIPFGISGFTPEVGATKWTIEFSMKGFDEEDNYVKKFYDYLRKIEEKVITFVHDNSQTIFGSQKSLLQIQDMFNSNIKESPNREPKFRVKVDTSMDGKIKPAIFDSEKSRIDVELENGIFSRKSGTAIVEINSVYFLNKKFGITWKLNQMKVFEPQRLKGFHMMVDEDESENLSGFSFRV